MNAIDKLFEWAENNHYLTSTEDMINAASKQFGTMEAELAALKALIRDIVAIIKDSETYECPMGGRAYCLAPHIVRHLILNRPEVVKILKEGK